MGNMKQDILRVLVKLFNIVYRILYFFGWDLVPLKLEEIIKPLTADEQAVILQQDLSEPIRLIIDGASQPSVTGFQRYSIKLTIRHNITTCAAVRKALAENPDVLNTHVDGPITIVGQPRSGTTMLQRLLACDPQFFSPMVWEMLKPTPPGRPDNWRNTQRYKDAQKVCDEIFTLMPDSFHTRHYFNIDQAEECLMLTTHVFLDSLLSSLPFLSKFREFLIRSPKEYRRKCYQYYKMALQCLFYKHSDGDKTLLLKAPIHALYLDTYKEILPNTRFIYIFRHIQTAVASCGSITKEYARMFGMEVDKGFAGRQNMEFCKHFSNQVVKTLQSISQESFIIIGYTELMKDPLEVVRRIYTHFNLQLTPEVEENMQRHLVEYHQYKFGKHEYIAEEYRVSEEDVKRDFKEYIEYFIDYPEKLI